MPDVDFALLPESYEKLSVENVQANKKLLRDLWQSAAPDLDLDHGALDALVLNPAATLLETARETFRTARKSSSFAALAADSADGVLEKMLDELAASYRVQRRKGTAASGRIRLFFQEDVYRVVGLSTIFEANGILFNVRNVETLQLSGDLPSTLPHYQNLEETQDGSGLFYADLTVYARTASAAGNLVQGTELTLYQSSLPYFVRAVALETFTGGENDEGTDSLVRRMILGVSAKVLSSHVNMKAALLEQFPDIRDSAVIGAGDLEMTRDKHSVFPGSTGGFCDWYVGTTRQLARTSVVVDAGYYDRLAAVSDRDYLRCPVLSHTLKTQNDKTVLSLSIVSDGESGVHGKPFSATAGSRIYGLALAASRSNKQDDILFARHYYLPEEQPEKPEIGHIMLSLDLVLP